VLFSVWKFREKPEDADHDGPNIHGNTRLEVIWTAIPAVLIAALCVYAFVVLEDIDDARADQLSVRVVGEQFTWTFYYPQGGGREIASNQLYLPTNRSVNFDVQTKDVLHDFWVPAFRMKIDAVPGITTKVMVTTTDKPGSYPVVCAELCGLGHSVMRQTARVVSPRAFDAWLAERAEAGGATASEGAGATAGSTAGEAPTQGGGSDGKTVFTSAGCGGCHALADAGTRGGVGPNLDETLRGKDEAYVERGIVDPEAELAAGFQTGIMPNTYRDTLKAEEVDALVQYLAEVTK
jgi:cytochrome c oxidase subunit 2